MKLILSVSLVFAMVLSVAAQQTQRYVVGAQGGVAKSDAIQLEWTLGEPAIQTVATPNGMLTEGFHQPVLTVEKVNEGDVQLPSVQVAPGTLAAKVFPNPTSGMLNVQLEGNLTQKVQLVLYDVTGQPLQQRTMFDTDALDIDLGALPSGVYGLRLRTEDGSFNEFFRVAKQR